MTRSLSLRWIARATAVAAALAACSCAATTEDPVADDSEAEGALTIGSHPAGTVLRATADLNLREGPSTSRRVVDIIPKGTQVTLVAAAPSGGFYQVRFRTTVGWSSGKYLDVVSEPAPVGSSIHDLVAASSCAKHSWNNRGRAPLGYLEGVAATFARAACSPTRSDVLVVSRAETGDTVHDALAWYRAQLAAAGMSASTAGPETLRHAYTLLMSLGMQESSGRHCVGRDTSASNTSSDSAEAGAWQTSYDSRGASGELPKLFAKYRASSAGCMLDTFARGVTCSAANWASWGSGDGLAFQKLEKECPSFAGEYAAVMLRVAGGSKGHYGPLRTRAAEIAPECDAMLAQVQALVARDPSVCAGL